MNRHLLYVAIMLLLAPVADASARTAPIDLSGQWILAVELQTLKGTSHEDQSVALTEVKGRLSGTFEHPRLGHIEVTGTRAGNDVSFLYRFRYDDGTRITTTYTGTIDQAGVMKGKIVVAGDPDGDRRGTWTGKKATASLFVSETSGSAGRGGYGWPSPRTAVTETVASAVGQPEHSNAVRGGSGLWRRASRAAGGPARQTGRPRSSSNRA